ncbi:hypothetical protein BKA66DRAFT_457190 [Pyrenochaeta sp. MPI-SDFR-AT-0127]|nr:hypothetical protein BKA66DRAFT_457190 [Pyrenochaeta sp. MPI-SDFR-AT-0127]
MAAVAHPLPYGTRHQFPIAIAWPIVDLADLSANLRCLELDRFSSADHFSLNARLTHSWLGHNPCGDALAKLARAEKSNSLSERSATQSGLHINRTCHSHHTEAHFAWARVALCEEVRPHCTHMRSRSDPASGIWKGVRLKEGFQNYKCTPMVATTRSSIIEAQNLKLPVLLEGQSFEQYGIALGVDIAPPSEAYHSAYRRM